MTTTLSERLHEILRETGDTKSAMAKKAGITLPTLLDILSGKSRGMRAITAYQLTHSYGLSFEWLLFGTGNKKSNSSVQPVEPESSPAVETKVQKSDFSLVDQQKQSAIVTESSSLSVVPWNDLLNWRSTAMQESAVEKLSPSVPNHEDARCVWTKVEGDAMSPTFKSGEMVCIDVDATPTNRCYVAAVIKGNIILRQYLVDGAEEFLASGESWPGERTIRLDDTIEIIGVVIAKSV